MGFEQVYVKSNYLKVKQGKFYLNGEEQAYPFTGKIVEFNYKSVNFDDGVEKRFCSIKFLDDQNISYKLDLDTEGNNYRTLISFLANKELIDLSLPVTLQPVLDKTEDKKYPRGSILVSQIVGGERVRAKAYFTKATPHGLPEWEFVKVGNKTMTDKSKHNEFLEAFVTQELSKRITPDAPELKQATTIVTEASVEEKPVAKEDVAFPPADEVQGEVVTKMPWD